jgi:F420H(2)-dependent quinone reductase
MVKRRLFVRVNRLANAIIRRLRLKRFRGADLLFLTTTGRKSGKTRTTPLLYLEDGGRWVVVASNGGADWQPGWWLNLQAGSPGVVELDGVRTSVTGTEITGPDREVMWERLNRWVFDYEGYQRKVSRRLAVVALQPVASAEEPTDTYAEQRDPSTEGTMTS